MSYKQLYDYVQTLSLHIPRNEIRRKVLALSDASQVRIVVSGLDTATCRGMYFSARNQSHPFVSYFGSHLIVTARGMNRCWTRFIIFKELMHLLDEQNEATDSGEKFDGLLTELSPVNQVSPNEKSQPYKSEVRATWMALGLFCPETHWQKFKEDRAKGHITDYGIALKLRLPEVYVPHLFSEHYETTIQAFRS